MDNWQCLLSLYYPSWEQEKLGINNFTRLCMCENDDCNYVASIIAHVDKVNTKGNRYIKECIYFSQGMLTQSIQEKKNHIHKTPSKDTTVATLVNLK